MSFIRRRPLRGNQSTENDSNADFDFDQEDDNFQEEEDSDLPTKKDIKKKASTTIISSQKVVVLEDLTYETLCCVKNSYARIIQLIMSRNVELPVLMWIPEDNQFLIDLSFSEPANAKDFIKFVQAHFNVHISIRCAQIWLCKLGFKYKTGSKQEIYHDGHQRPDVLLALKKYIVKMKDMQGQCGPTMEDGVSGVRLVDPTMPRVVISWHDECAAHACERHDRQWRCKEASGRIQEKAEDHAAW
jgi:hypothetical protein